MVHYDWQVEARRWLNSRRDITPALAESVVAFFEHSFRNTRHPERAWFGAHSSGLSLVVGGIYLAAVHRTGQDKGFWLLVDQQPPEIEGVEYRPVLSTQGARYPLVWAHSASITAISEVVANERIWELFGAASEKILYASRIAGDRDSVQEKRQKRRLSEFFGKFEVNLFPDEVDEEVVFREGARRQVTVNAYERDDKARERCIHHHGTRCTICNFSFGEVYGQVAKGFIHVHHLRPLSEIGSEYTVDPVEDLRPVCPNCHVVLHLRRPAFSIQEVKALLRQGQTA